MPNAILVGEMQTSQTQIRPVGLGICSGLQYLLKKCSIRICAKIRKRPTQQPLKGKWSGPIDKKWEISFGLDGLFCNVKNCFYVRMQIVLSEGSNSALTMFF